MYWDNEINVCGTLIQLNSKIQNLISYICALIIIVWVYMIYHINQVLRKLVLLMICRQNTLYIYITWLDWYIPHQLIPRILQIPVVYQKVRLVKLELRVRDWYVPHPLFMLLKISYDLILEILL
jgi:hypothetical protein